MNKIICGHCGVEFTKVGSKAKYRKYCDSICSKRANKIRSRIRARTRKDIGLSIKQLTVDSDNLLIRLQEQKGSYDD